MLAHATSSDEELSEPDGKRHGKNVAMTVYTIAIIAALIGALVYLYVTHKGGEPHGSNRQRTNAPVVTR